MPTFLKIGDLRHFGSEPPLYAYLPIGYLIKYGRSDVTSGRTDGGYGWSLVRIMYRVVNTNVFSGAELHFQVLSKQRYNSKYREYFMSLARNEKVIFKFQRVPIEIFRTADLGDIPNIYCTRISECRKRFIPRKNTVQV